MNTSKSDLSTGERAICTTVERLLGVRAQPWDVGGRSGAVDALLHYPDGRTAAFEITALAERDDMHLDALLERIDYELPVPVEAMWWWDIHIRSVADLPRLRECYADVLLLCEKYAVVTPADLSPLVREAHEDVQWVLAAGVDMLGHPSVPAREDGRERHVNILTPGGGGMRNLAGLRDALVDAFTAPHIVKHLEKLDAPEYADLAEWHLFMPVHPHALPDDVVMGLWRSDRLPADPPPIPDHVTHLWLQFAGRVLLWCGGRWRRFELA